MPPSARDLLIREQCIENEEETGLSIMRTRCCFTLVEIMIVVAIIGLLATIAFPAYDDARKRSQVNRFASDIRVATSAFEMYAIENRGFPPDTTPGIIPNGMASYLDGMDWAGATTLGGRWDWDYRQFGVRAGVSVYQPTCEIEELESVDAIIDDGNLSSGRFRSRSAGYIYVIEY